jgi:hypothetical protein
MTLLKRLWLRILVALVIWMVLLALMWASGIIG